MGKLLVDRIKTLFMNHRRVVMVRHGESIWTKNNMFCGWYDAPLSDKGMSEAVEAGKLLRNEGLKFDIAFTSQLSRAQTTLKLVIHENCQPDLPIKSSWKLNERHYGALTGMKKEEAVLKYGFEQVQIWRRSYDILPPEMDEQHDYYKDIKNSSEIRVPRAETLKSTMERVIPYWIENIIPSINEGKRVLIISHGTCLRSLIKHLDNISDDDIVNINIPTAIPFIYTLNSNGKPIGPVKYLGDEETVRYKIKRAASIDNKG